jgi:hypothetical protein
MRVFGYDLSLSKAKSEKNLKQIDLEANGSQVVSKSMARVFDFDFVARSEIDLVNAYRRISYMTEVSTAIDEIVNEMVVVDDETDVVQLDTTKLKEAKITSDGVIQAIEEEFNTVTQLLDFNNTAYTKARDWYVDGKIIFQKVIDTDKPKDGVKKLVQLDPRKVRRVTIVDEDHEGMFSIVEEFYVYAAIIPDKDDKLSSSFSMQMSMSDYNELRRANMIFRIEKDALIFVDSGLLDKSSGIAYGHLHKAVRVANQLDLVETALIIYRLARSSERRVIYVDPGNLPPTKAQQHLENVKAEFRNKTYYDTVQGTVEDKARVMSLQEDYFMLRNGNKTTEITTLQAGENLGNIEDILFFRDKLLNSLNVPTSRFKENSSPFNAGTQISQEEVKFHRFVTRLRSQFSKIFLDLLETQLVLKKIIRPTEFLEIMQLLRFKYNKDGFFSEARDIEILERRLSTLESIKGYIGVYWPNEYIRTRVLGQTNEEIEYFDKKIKEESGKSQYSNRNIELPEDTIEFEPEKETTRGDQRNVL